ncbi:gamma tubulin complex protein 3 [Cryptosporidium ubiquitum]|uniref:Gamma tubulin complex protein 3 n=1 Tax=Cryptosporidium ubiquitum TaxID=857276 RepID=A0A1J4MG83_9CRYT|nr:gamma tubulin complex protein 3 [Cryptosporidium ubiquitum]OII73238.1 gamma tubulin complex protein 3 [Cryptosporidium ubiquitum]
MVSEKPIIIPELLKELVYKEIENSNIFKGKTSERSKLAQKCYLTSLKLIKSHIVSGVKESNFENPLEDAHELLLSKGRSTQIHKLNRLYEKLSNLCLAIPELNYLSKNQNSNSLSRNQNTNFQDKILRLLLPLFDTGSRDKYDQENLGNSIHNLNPTKDLQQSVSPVLSRFREPNTPLASGSSSSLGNDEFAIQTRNSSNDHALTSVYNEVISSNSNGNSINNSLEVYKEEFGMIESNDSYSVPLFVLEKCLLSPTQELALVHDILYALQGFEAQFVKYDISTDSYILNPSVYSLETTREIVTEICHFGTIYKRMTKIINYYKQELENSYLKERSMLTKTLIEFTQDLLSEYSQFIVSQQNEVQDSMIALSKLDPGVNPNLELLRSNKPMLTLRKLLNRVNDQYYKKERIFAILEGLFGQTSSSIISCLNIHRNNGNQYQEKVFENLFHKCTSVWLQDLNMILRHGTTRRYPYDLESNQRSKTVIDFESKLGEFFIKGNLQEGIKIDESRVPNFLLIETAHQITHISETRIILKAFLPQDEDAKLAEELGIPEITSEMVSDLNRIPLDSTLNSIQSKLDLKLKELIIDEGSLISRLKIIRDYLICFNGDFSDLLIRNMENELDKPSESVSLQNLEEIFESTKRSCSKFDFQDNFQVSLLDDQLYNKPGSCGWDIFTLDFLLPERTNLSLILTTNQLKRYKRIFRTVWKLKHVIHKLNSTWVQLVKYLRQNELCIPSDTIDISLLRQSSCFIRSLIITLNTIQNLLSFSSISYLWSSLENLLPKASNVYKMQDLHNTYISYIESNLFISSSSSSSSSSSPSSQEQKLTQDLYLCLDLLFESSLFLCKVIKTILNNLLIHENDHENDSRQMHSFETNNIILSLGDEIYESSNNFKNYFKSFHTNLSLLIQLKHDCLHYSPLLHFQINLFESLLEQLTLHFKFLD